MKTLLILYLSKCHCYVRCQSRRDLSHTRNRTLFLVMAQLFLVPSTTSAHFPATLLSLDPAPQTNILVPDKLPHDVNPALVYRQVVVELVRDAIERGQAGPRNRREVVVLVVQADIIREEVECAVVRVRLGQGDFVRGVGGVLVRLLEDVVLGDEVAGAGVQRAREEAAQDQVAERPSARKLHQCVVEGELHDDVEEVDLGERQLVHEHGAQGVEEDLEGGEKGLAGDGVKEEGFECSGQVCVEAVDAQRLVVGQMVGSEGSAVRDANGQVCEDGEDAIGQRRAEGQVVGYLVDGKEEVLVGCRADDVCCEEEGPGQHGRVAEEEGAEDLYRHDEQDDIFGERLGAAKLGYLRQLAGEQQESGGIAYLWVRLDNGHPP